MHKHIALVSLAVLFLISAAGIQAQETTNTIAPEESITISDLGISDTGILPTSPFYFFKEWGRGVQGLFTFNPVAKAELELKIVNEKAAEIKKITETQPQNTQAIQKALENYQKNQENLRSKLENLKETSQNPKVDALLNNLTDRVVKHEKLFDEISFKFGDNEAISGTISNARAGSEVLIGEASKKDDPAKFASRLEKVLLEEKGGDLKHARSVEIIDRFSGQTPEAVRESLERLREEFSDRLETDIEELVREKGESVLEEKINNTPGDFAKRSVIIEEIQKRAEKQLAETLGRAMGQIEKVLEREMDLAQKAKEQIGRAEKMINEARQKAIVSDLLDEAREHLKEAIAAFGEEKYGEAFGQARSAEVLARNAMKSFEKQKPQIENFEQHLKELAEKIRTYENLLKERNFTREQNKDAYELLDNAVLHLGYAKEAFVKENLENSKLHISHTREFLSKLSRLIEIRHIRSDEKPTEVETVKPTPTLKPVEPINSIETVKPVGLVYTCTDSDKINYNAVGVVTDAGKKYVDYCLDASMLKEYSCSISDAHPTGIVKEEIYTCASGCENGACKTIEKPVPAPPETTSGY